MEDTTDSLRALATDWTLAGDEQLLNLLKTTHQKIVTKCQEVNTKLDEMITALDDSSIDLQNVNNKFMALSNRQFIESRVYDDDTELNTEKNPEQPSEEPEPVDQLITILKRSLDVVDGAHETAEILDESDSDDSDIQISVVLKPKDAYAHRPLPYIIGSQSWKNKWHAGLITEDSDTDSTTSRRDANEEQYSSEDEFYAARLGLPPTSANLSDSGSSLHSSPREQEAGSEKSPAAVAAELQAWLGSARPPVQQETEDLPPQPTNKTVYKPQKPITSTIFTDEPPPIDDQYAEVDSQEEDDIFAEINKKQPYNNHNRSGNYVDDLFDTVTQDDSGFSKNKPETSAKQKTTLFDEENEPGLFAEQPKISKESKNNKVEENPTKKPIGGISLFGSNKGTESIGAAILKINRRKASSSESDGDENTNKKTPANESSFSDDDSANDANAIFDNLFAKAKQAEQKLVKPSQSQKFDRPRPEAKAAVPVKKNPVIDKPKPVNDIFSDNIFDDIDDIFNDIKIPSKEASKVAKSIFDDDDDLFADIAKKDTKLVKDTKSGATSSLNKSIFDSDEEEDDLFGKVSKNEPTNKKETTESQNKVATKESSNKNNIKDSIPEIKEPIFTTPVNTEQKTNVKSKSIFDSDSDDDIFSSVNIKTVAKNENTNSINVNVETETELFTEQKEKVKETLKAHEKQVFQSPMLFEEDEIDDLFVNANKAKEITDDISNIEDIVPEYIIPDLNKDIPEENLNFDDIENNTEIKPENTAVNTKTQRVIDPELSNKSNQVKIDDDIFTITKIQTSDSRTKEQVSREDVIEASQGVEVEIKSNSTEVTAQTQLDRKENTENEALKTGTQSAISDNSKRDKQLPETSKSIKVKQALIPENRKGNTENEALKTGTQSVISDIDKIDEQQPKTSEPNKFKQALIPEKKPPILLSAFDDIFSEPPAFEKVKESKKITNVNALFEDDSDDESLFFKKNDVISDEKPEIFSPSADFAIFADEPPALDVDFTSKGNKVDDDDDLFSSVHKPAKTTNLFQSEPPEIDDWDDVIQTEKTVADTTVKAKSMPVEVDDELFGASNNTDIKAATSVKVPTADIPSDDELFSNKPKVPELSQKGDTEINKDIDQVDDITNSEEVTESKKIGKINTKNFKINVQALVPGASPKKIAKERSSDDILGINNTKTAEFNTNNIKEYTEVDNAEPITVKSISFESKQESGILDNNLSKQRAKIQIKRRPSTRKARHEAVRKSIINNDDETDNSSSIDDPKPKTIVKRTSDETSEGEQITTDAKEESTEIVNQGNIVKNADTTSPINKNKSSKHNEGKAKDSNQQNKTDVETTAKTTFKQTINIHDEITRDLSTKNADEIDSQTDFEKKNDVSSEEIAGQSTTTKVKYILNDEDIFQTTNSLPTTKSTNQKAVSDSKPQQETKAKNANNNELSKPAQPKSKSLFDLSDDEEDLFGKSLKKKVEVKSKLFDSDSEDDLFSGKKDKKVKKETAKAKGSLFSDDDDDDLFGAKTKTKAAAESSKIQTKPTASKNTASTSEIAFEDPLSMLVDD